MTEHSHVLTDEQFQALLSALRQAAADACEALAKWLSEESLMQLDSVDRLMLSEATGLLGTELPICCGSMTMPQEFPGQLLVAFDDASGFALADMVLQQPLGTSTSWGEMEESAALESTNILCCAYLNSLVEKLFAENDSLRELIPEPPEFRKDYAESVLQFAFMEQATRGDEIFLVRTKFQVADDSLSWTLLWIPDSAAIDSLPQFIGGN